MVFGGGDVGLMGVASASCLAAGGEVIGVIPDALLDRELIHPTQVEMRVVGSMHERKALMAELSDGFIVLPGGFGTLDELFEAVTWAQLGIHRKPIGLLNSGGFFDVLLSFLDQLVSDGFLLQRHRDLLITGAEPADLLDQMERWVAPDLAKWAEVGNT